jgi:hypothetical protein
MEEVFGNGNKLKEYKANKNRVNINIMTKFWIMSKKLAYKIYPNSTLKQFQTNLPYWNKNKNNNNNSQLSDYIKIYMPQERIPKNIMQKMMGSRKNKIKNMHKIYGN